MLKKLYNYKLKILFVSIFLCAIVSIRAFEDVLFYDPFLRYFRNEFSRLPLPEFDGIRLLGGLALRYFLNMIFSLGIIYTLFKDFDLTKFSALLYLVFFILLIIAFFVVLHFFGSDQKMLLFYIRRFLIQPIFLLLFLPAFYYQRKVSKNNIS